MRRDFSYLPPLISILLLFSTLSYGQAWSGIIAPSRAIDWSHAGLPATLPDGETTPNPWTPPTRTQCGSTLSPVGGSSDDVPQIISALSSCPAGHYVLLGNGTFNIETNLFLSPGYTNNHDSVTLRGSGPMSTILKTNGGGIYIGAASSGGDGAVTSGSTLSSGSTSVTIQKVSGTPTIGNIASFIQCDTGQTYTPLGNPITSSSNCTGSHTDNGGLYMCGGDSVCMTDSPGGADAYTQGQLVLITSVTSSGSNYVVGFSPGLYLPNWSYNQSATLSWGSQSYFSVGMGLEDLTVILQSGASQNIIMANAYASWIKGVRVVGQGGNFSIVLGNAKNSLVMNNYINVQGTASSAGPPAFTFGGNYSGANSDDLILNNLMQGMIEGGGTNEGDVLAYNYIRDSLVGYPQNSDFQHQAGSAFFLREGNRQGVSRDDDTWGTHNLNTFFRNFYSCWDPPYPVSNNNAVLIDSFSRFENVIGNALGSSYCTSYQTVGSNAGHAIYTINSGGTDSLADTSLMRWGNYDTVNAAAQWNSSEVPTSLSGNAAPFENSVPSSHSLPASFFLGVSAHLTGGTGLSWWKVCTSWTTFPTSCAGTQTQPFPAIGPDVTGGNNINGYAYDIPAALAYETLPIDTTYQKSFSVTGSSWSSGTEKLTVSGLPSGTGSSVNIMGGFQLSGANSTCYPGGNTSSELSVTGSSSSTITYALASNPGVACTGTLKWPDVREFDERVYQTDTGGGDPSVNPPTALSAVVN